MGLTPCHTKDYDDPVAFARRKNKVNISSVLRSADSVSIRKRNLKKQSQLASLRLEIRSTKLYNSGAFAGCLLPGVVPEIPNKDIFGTLFEKTKPICRMLK
jgi:hypothetical protein